MLSKTWIITKNPYIHNNKTNMTENTECERLNIEKIDSNFNVIYIDHHSDKIIKD